MLEFNQMILLSLTLIIVSLFILYYLMVTGLKQQRSKLKQELWVEIRKETPQGCPHYYGYMSVYPRNKPIPSECMGCTKLLVCFEPLTGPRGLWLMQKDENPLIKRSF